uniref:Uncharacterized protein n=1 Tax=Anguilla anguilla TaxID=7936 RepID=A0A0E9QS05_ANGAN
MWRLTSFSSSRRSALARLLKMAVS